MKNEHEEAFSGAAAAAYDQQWSRLAPVKQSLNLAMGLAMENLGPAPNFLCVGVGTGTEMLALTEFFPEARFTALDPSSDMLSQCKAKMTDAGLASRCRFHHGYLADLSVNESFDGATSLLVSHFLTERSSRLAFFADIAKHLRTGGLLVTADITSDTLHPLFPRRREFWGKTLAFAGMEPDQVAEFTASLTESLAVVPQTETEKLLQEAGFRDPISIYSFMLIQAWVTQKA